MYRWKHCIVVRGQDPATDITILQHSSIPKNHTMIAKYLVMCFNSTKTCYDTAKNAVKETPSPPTSDNKQEAQEFFENYHEKVCELNFKGYRGWCRVYSVYDGDTLTAGIPLFGKVFKYSIRMDGIDTPEMRGDDKANAVMARERLVELITGRKTTTKEDFDRKVFLVWFECHGFDKYRRLLGDVKLSPTSQSLSEVLIQEGFGRFYDGGKKE
jgi:endonuclease YncB( thermonuclease family)